jgi:hypothetical protein
VNELKLYPLTCPQCGAPGVVREAVRITECERCGALLCLTAVDTPRYEAESNVNAAQAITAARAWLDQRRQTGIFGRPELVFVPYHEVSGRRVGVFERKVPVRKRVRRSMYSAASGGQDAEPEYEYTQKEDTKVMVSDIQQIAPAAQTPWDLRMFDADAARKAAQLHTFDLVEAQRRATVYVEEKKHELQADYRFGLRGSAEMVATSRRTLFFPFWSIPLQTETGSYEIVVDGIAGGIVAWRLPRIYQASTLNWAVLAVPGALALGQFLRATLLGSSILNPGIGLIVGIVALGAALWRSNRPDWSVQTWPDAATIVRLEQHGR